MKNIQKCCVLTLYNDRGQIITIIGGSHIPNELLLLCIAEEAKKMAARLQPIEVTTNESKSLAVLDHHSVCEPCSHSALGGK